MIQKEVILNLLNLELLYFEKERIWPYLVLKPQKMIQMEKVKLTKKLKN